MRKLPIISQSLNFYYSLITCAFLLAQIHPGSAMEWHTVKQAPPKTTRPINRSPNRAGVKPAQAKGTKPDNAGPDTVKPGAAVGLPAAGTLAGDVPAVKAGAGNTAPAEAPYLKPEILAIRTSKALKDLDSVKTSKKDTVTKKIKANYQIQIQISHPKEFLELRPQDNSRLVLYANGITLPGMTTDYYSALGSDYVKAKGKLLGDTQWITFIFTRDSTTKNAWDALYKISDWKVNNTNFELSLGWEGMYPLSYAATFKTGHKITLTYYENIVFYLLCAMYVIFLAYFIDRCKHTGLIRDPDKTGKGQYGPYSLAQTQLAFWTVIISGGFIYLILLTGLTDSLNDSCLILLGITGGTTGLAGFIDYAKKRQQQSAENTAIAANMPIAKEFIKTHQGFLTDITSDGVNISVQRTQTVLWNFILGGYFIWYVVSNKSMPVFTNTLLLLAGASSLMYLTSKVPENPQAPTTAGTKPDTDSTKGPVNPGADTGDTHRDDLPPIPEKPVPFQEPPAQDDSPVAPAPPQAADPDDGQDAPRAPAPPEG